MRPLGSLRLDAVSGQEASGFVDVKTGAETALAGTFAATRCAKP